MSQIEKTRIELEEEDDDNYNAFPVEYDARSIRTQTLTIPVLPSEEADHETNSEAHEAFQIELEARPDWRIPIINYIKNGELPPERWEARKLKAKSSRYCILQDNLYKRSLREPYLLCVTSKDAFTIMNETHGGSCGSHSGGRSLAIRIKKHGYFWPTIAGDSEQFSLKCDKCQQHASMIHQPTQKLSSVSSPYPFMKWSLDIVGPMVSSSSARLRFLLVLTDYFTKWVEAEAYHKITEHNGKEFHLEKHRLSTWSPIRDYNQQWATVYIYYFHRIL